MSRKFIKISPEAHEKCTIIATQTIMYIAVKKYLFYVKEIYWLENSNHIA